VALLTLFCKKNEVSPQPETIRFIRIIRGSESCDAHSTPKLLVEIPHYCHRYEMAKNPPRSGNGTNLSCFLTFFITIFRAKFFFYFLS